MGHELVYGHHTSDEINCHQHDSDCCDHHGENENHVPCLVDIDPHVSSQNVDVSHETDLDNGNDFCDLAYTISTGLIADIPNEVPPDRIIPESYSLLFCRSHGLRGPPIA